MTKITKESIRDLIVETRADLHDISKGLKKTYDRRRALDCRLIERSKSHKGYCKYMITISEKDGTVHKQPAYGKDMQDALSRLMHRERFVRVEQSLGTGWPFIAWMIIMGVPAYFMEKTGSPVYILYGFLGVGVTIGMLAWYHNYVNRGQ